MNSNIHLYLYSHFLCLIFLGITNAKDFCPWENFSPECSTDEVLVMQSATYGMMSEGRCVEEDFGFLGCSSDQLWYFDQQCSGRSKCDITISGSNKDLKDRLTILCPVPYLEAEYNCIKVFSPTNGQCHKAMQLKVNPNPGYLASFTSVQTSCGHGNSPWVLEAQSGQTINLTLVDFSWDENGGGEECPRVYGLILSYTSDEVVQICGGRTRIQQLKYSPSHQIQVVLEEAAVASYHFVIKYEALGCPDVVPPTNAWVRKVGSDVRVGCHASSDAWQLKCVGSHWIGTTGTCPPVTVATSTEIQRIEKENFNDFHVTAFAIGCLSIIVCCLTVTLGIYCIKRYQVKAEFSYSKANTPSLYLAPKSTNQWHSSSVTTGGTTNRPSALSHGCFEETLPDITNSETLLSRRPQPPYNGGTVNRSNGNDVTQCTQFLPRNSVQQEQVYGASRASEEESVKYFVLEKPPGYNTNSA